MGDYWSVWKQFVLQGVMEEEQLPPSLAQSWRRCAALGLDPYAPVSTSAGGMTERKAGTSSLTLLEFVRPAMEDLHQFAEGAECVIMFADADARIVDIVGDEAIWRELDHLGLAAGAAWSEENLGSNALSLALSESFPIHLEGAMHYRATLHPFYTAAAPVHDILGMAVGVLGVIGRHEHAHPHTLGMITAAAQAVSNQLQMQVWLSNANDLLSELKTILQTLSDGILLLRNDGVISQMNGPAGTLLGLSPASVTGRRLRDTLPLPAVLEQALKARQSLSYEELVFDTAQGRVTCLCTVKPIPNYRGEPGLAEVISSAGLTLPESVSSGGFVLILRSIERVQKLVHRMTGMRARLTFANIVGESQALNESLRLARLVSTSNSTVLLHGETGTGKEIFTQSIHNSSARASGPFVAINCAAIPRELINTELFGYEGGAFTGADRQGRPGKFEQAHGGTLFLDEIGDMPRDLQTSLLRAIETHTIVRVGGHRVIPADVRIIAATHKDLREEARSGNFRSDLYYRLNVLTIEIPALRERAGDLPLLVRHFLQRQSSILGHSFSITPEALEAIERYYWPGNIRELENLLERLTYLTPDSNITLRDLPPDIQRLVSSQSDVPPLASPDDGVLVLPSSSTNGALKDHSSHAEMQAISEAWRAANGSVTLAAALLGISRITLWRKLRRYSLTRENASS